MSMLHATENPTNGRLDLEVKPNTHAEELKRLLAVVEPRLLNFVAAAGATAPAVDEKFAPTSIPSDEKKNAVSSSTTILDVVEPDRLYQSLNLDFPENGEGLNSLARIVPQLLQSSVNVWHPGFLSKLYSSPSPVGVVSELILAILNTNVHVFDVSPALTIIEKKTARALASKFALVGPRAGGIIQPGGSGANLSAMVIARTTQFPETKEYGCSDKKFVVFTSAHGHYSLEKAAQIIGLGRAAVWKVPTNDAGSMLVNELEVLVKRAKTSGFAPFMVNATAGTTVLGSYDPLLEIGQICKREQLWFHVDASWGGAVMFSAKHRSKMHGVELADSVTFNPHKMLKAPLTCSFLLTPDVKIFWESNTLPAGYLFHNSTSDAPADFSQDGADMQGSAAAAAAANEEADTHWDIADMTLQCGRRGDALKFALDWQSRGGALYERLVDEAFETAAYLAQLLDEHPNFILVSQRPPPCLQVCFYWAPQGIASGPQVNAQRTPAIARALIRENFILDHAPGHDGLFLRAVINTGTEKKTADCLVAAVDRVALHLEVPKMT